MRCKNIVFFILSFLATGLAKAETFLPICTYYHHDKDIKVAEVLHIEQDQLYSIVGEEAESMVISDDENNEKFSHLQLRASRLIYTETNQLPKSPPLYVCNALKCPKTRNETCDPLIPYTKPRKDIVAAEKESPKIFTVYLRGTGSSLKKDGPPSAVYPTGETISVLETETAGEKNIDFIGIDGPGSQNHDLLETSTSKKVTVYDERLGIYAGFGTKETVENILNIMKGKSENIHHAGMLKQKKRIQVVNIIGWSRGAITGIQLANEMFYDAELQHIKVNLFLIDPVPGLALSVGTLFWDRIKMLQQNVKDVVILVAENELSHGFNALLPKPVGEINLNILPMPGYHATLVGNSNHNGKVDTAVSFKNNKIGAKQLSFSSGDPTLASVGKLVKYFARYFLEKHGTRFKSEPAEMSPEEMLRVYENLVTPESSKLFDTISREYYTGADDILPLGSYLWGSPSTRRITIGDNKFYSKLNVIQSAWRNDKYVNWHHYLLKKGDMPYGEKSTHSLKSIEETWLNFPRMILLPKAEKADPINEPLSPEELKELHQSMEDLL